MPQGLTLPGAGYPVTDSLPAVLGERQQNRGFESLAISADGQTLYAAMQSPLVNPDKDTAAKSRVIRVLALDVATGKPSAEYVYLAEDVAAFDPGAQGDQSEMKISAMGWYGPDQLLVDERTDEVTKLYLVRLSGATNILDGELDDPAHRPSLEQTVPAGVAPLAKSLLVDVTGAVADAPTKIEGVAVRDPSTVAVANDNDFGMRDGPDAFDAQGTSSTPASRPACCCCTYPRGSPARVSARPSARPRSTGARAVTAGSAGERGGRRRAGPRPRTGACHPQPGTRLPARAGSRHLARRGRR